MKIFTALSLFLLLIFNVSASEKKNRDKYTRYIGSKYNTLLEALNKLGGLSIYGKGHSNMGHLRYVPLKYPFPADEQKRAGKLRAKYLRLPFNKTDPNNPNLNEIMRIGDDLGKIHDAMNSVFTTWTDDHYNKLKSLIPRINKLWNSFKDDYFETFSEDSATRNEPFFKGLNRDLENWEVKTVEDIDEE